MRFSQVDLSTAPPLLSLTVVPTILPPQSKIVQFQLNDLPTNFDIKYKAAGDDWEKANASLVEDVVQSTIIDKKDSILSQIRQNVNDKLKDNEDAQIPLPNIPITFDGISLNLAPSNLNISTSGSDYVLITGTVTIG